MVSDVTQMVHVITCHTGDGEGGGSLSLALGLVLSVYFVC